MENNTKKIKRIKKLRSRTIGSHLIEMIFTEIIIIGIVAFLSVITIISTMNYSFNRNHAEQEKLVNQIKDLSINTKNRESLITNYIADAEYLKNVVIVNEKGEIQEAYGNNPNFSKDYYRLNSSEKIKLRRKDIYRDTKLNAKGINGDEDISNFKLFFKALDFPTYINEPELIREANNPFLVIYDHAYFTTNENDMFISMESDCILTKYQSFVIGFAAVFFAATFLFLFAYEIIKIIGLIVESKRITAFLSVDMVTGGMNKEWFLRRCQKLNKYKRQYVIIQLRLEKYRNYCMAYGVKSGEQLLQSLNSTLARCITSREAVAHLEKADFILLLRNDGFVEKRMIRIMEALCGLYTGQHLLFSAGACKVEGPKSFIPELITNAGLAISDIAEVNNNFVWFTDEMKENQVWERKVADEMDKALEEHQFAVYLQPKYSTNKEVLSAAEALVRWIHPEWGFVNPGKFIPIFEKNGFIIKLDDYMLEEVAKLQADWLSKGKNLVPISVNVSRAHFTQLDLAEHICSIIDKYKVPHEYIELELTESAFFDDKEVLLSTVKKLKDFGFKISMDDFGAGYSSLNSLKELQLDIIKLDAEFFRGCDDEKRANTIVSETISLAKNLGLSVVAEGIETREQVDFLSQNNCDLIQGFYFSKPLPVVEFEQKAFGTTEN